MQGLWWWPDVRKDDVTRLYDDVTRLYDDVTRLYDDVTRLHGADVRKDDAIAWFSLREWQDGLV